jgi:NAD(P)H-nitrite reductase large subunit
VDTVGDSNYHICLNKDCEVIYFNSEEDLIFEKEQVRLPIWFKKDADPKYICYCNKVTEEQITDALQKDDAKNIKDIIRITGAMITDNVRLKIL